MSLNFQKISRNLSKNTFKKKINNNFNTKKKMSLEITSNHVYGFRYGTWAKIIGTTKIENRECYHVKFPDGEEDYWVVKDDWDTYKFRKSH